MEIRELGEKIEAAVFDLDGTLVDSLSFFKYFWPALGRRFFGVENYMPPTYVDMQIRTMPARESCDYIADELWIMGKGQEIYELEMEIMDDFYKNVAKLKVGVVEYLDSLRKKGIKTAIASASSIPIIRFNLERYGILDKFDYLFSCADLGVGKDVPDVYLAAEKQLGGDRSKICVYEDSCVALETAKRAGFMTVGIYDEGNYEHDRLKAASDVYLGEGMTFLDLI